MSTESRHHVSIVSADTLFSSLMKAVLDNSLALRPATVHTNMDEAIAEWASDPPQAILVDISTVKGSILEFLNALQAGCRGAALLVLTEAADEKSIVASWHAGASGCLLKSTPLGRICEAINETRAGGCP